MIHACEISKEPGIQGVCGLFGKDDVAGSNVEGFIQALREMVELFHITWGMTPFQEPDSGESVETGFVLELKGRHEPVADHLQRRCRHCANLLLAMRVIADWVFPPRGKCSFCEVQAHSNFVHGDQQGQRENCSTRTLRLVTQQGTRCQLGACHIWCMRTMTERLNRIGSVERGRNTILGRKD